jgi:hypothetical protein
MRFLPKSGIPAPLMNIREESKKKLRGRAVKPRKSLQNKKIILIAM